ncbi:hypothetical protein [Vibrio diazotrophicus]|uniref:hypothetical protein n=1 Tax=Vibrio diazotrophicus TaxID=685 RepID=UPI000C9E622F|nr:hypothetical protein [Vibrio diazotrophicus]PNH94059.1 hypothetical protein C1M59_04860 [Vibrio diazotrophicus]
MDKKKINFSANKVIVHGVEVSAEGVPVRDIVESINEYDAAEHMNTGFLLGAIGKDSVIAWLEEQGYQVI